MSRDVGAYCTLVALVSLLFFLMTEDHRELSSGIRYTTDGSRTFTVSEYFADLEQRLSRFRKKTGYTIKLVDVHGVAGQDMDIIATEQFDLLQKDDPESKGIVVAIIGSAKGGAAIKTSENLRARFQNQNVGRKITAILEGRSQTLALEQVVHVIMQHLNLWFYVLDPPKIPMFLVRSPTAEMIVLVFAPVLGLLTGISLIAFTPIRHLRQWSRFGGCGVIGVCAVLVFVFIVRQPGGIYPGMFGYALGMGFIVSGVIGLLKQFWLYETFEGRQSGGWWNGPVHFRYG